MKKLYFTVFTLLISAAYIFGQPERDSLTMSPQYANDIFYSMKTGEVSAVPRNNWDIAFYTARFSSGILINEGMGDMLYTYPNGDTADWANIDTTGMSEWPPMYNSPSMWEEGAFGVHALGHPDYGWGVYNSVNHNVYGDSLFVMKTQEGYKKIWIVMKKSIENIYVFRFADLDGSNEQLVELDVNPYTGKNFVYYSLSANEPVDREPPSEDWDILFTKYVDSVPDNEGNFSPYLVTGATLNVSTKANNFYPVTEDFNDWMSKPMDSAKNTIGYDWKQFDFNAFSWNVTDSNYYFIRNFNGDIYKLKFISWDGSSTGDFVLDKWLVSLSSVSEKYSTPLSLNVYPNPASESFAVKSSEELQGDVTLMIIDRSGRQVYRAVYAGRELNSGIRLSNLNLKQGLYILNIKGAGHTGSTKLIIR